MKIAAKGSDNVLHIRKGDIGTVIAWNKDGTRATVIWDRPCNNGNPRYTTIMSGNFSEVVDDDYWDAGDDERALDEYGFHCSMDVDMMDFG